MRVDRLADGLYFPSNDVLTLPSSVELAVSQQVKESVSLLAITKSKYFSCFSNSDFMLNLILLLGVFLSNFDTLYRCHSGHLSSSNKKEFC